MPFKTNLSCFTACLRPKKLCNKIRKDPYGEIPVIPAYKTPMEWPEKTSKVEAGLGSGDAAPEDPAPDTQHPSMVEAHPDVTSKVEVTENANSLHYSYKAEAPKCKLSIWLCKEFVPPPPCKAIVELEERIRAQKFRFPRIQQDWLRKQILKKNWIRSVQKIHKEVSAALPLYLQTEEKIEREKAQAVEQAKSKRPDCKWRAFVFPRMPSDWLRKQMLREAFMDDIRAAYKGLQKVLPLYNDTMETLCAAEGETLKD